MHHISNYHVFYQKMRQKLVRALSGTPIHISVVSFSSELRKETHPWSITVEGLDIKKQWGIVNKKIWAEAYLCTLRKFSCQTIFPLKLILSLYHWDWLCHTNFVSKLSKILTCSTSGSFVLFYSENTQTNWKCSCFLDHREKVLPPTSTECSR